MTGITLSLTNHTTVDCVGLITNTKHDPRFLCRRHLQVRRMHYVFGSSVCERVRACGRASRKVSTIPWKPTEGILPNVGWWCSWISLGFEGRQFKVNVERRYKVRCEKLGPHIFWKAWSFTIKLERDAKMPYSRHEGHRFHRSRSDRYQV